MIFSPLVCYRRYTPRKTKQMTTAQMTTAKEIARQIKKELNAAFKGKPQAQKVKFSVKSKHIRGIGHDEIEISWVGGVFINEVKAIAGKFNTYKNYSFPAIDYFHAEGVRIEYRRDLNQADIDFLEGFVVPDFPVNYEVTFEKYYDSEGFDVTIMRDGDYLYRSNERYEQLTQYSESGAIAEEIPDYVWESAWAKKNEAVQVEIVETTPETIKEVKAPAATEPTKVISLADFKESKVQSIENDHLELADFLQEMPTNRRMHILKEMAESENPRVYVQSLLASMRAIAAAGF